MKGSNNQLWTYDAKWKHLMSSTVDHDDDDTIDDDDYIGSGTCLTANITQGVSSHMATTFRAPCTPGDLSQQWVVTQASR
jgi:hypothetical protein